MNTSKIIAFSSFISLLVLFGCKQDNRKEINHCKCAIPESVDKKTERGQGSSDQSWAVGANGSIEGVVRKAIDAKISVSGSYSNSNLKIEEVYKEIIGSNPQITQKANLYRSVSCAYYEIACQDKTINEKEKTDRLNEIVFLYAKNIDKIIDEEKNTKSEIKPVLVESDIKEEKKWVIKEETIELKEWQNCTNEDCLGLKNINKIEKVSFVLERRKAKGNWESFGEIHTSKELIDKLRFGSWSNPECANAEIGKWQGTGWHYPAGSCGTGSGNKYMAVEKVTVKVTYQSKE